MYGNTETSPRPNGNGSCSKRRKQLGMHGVGKERLCPPLPAAALNNTPDSAVEKYFRKKNKVSTTAAVKRCSTEVYLLKRKLKLTTSRSICSLPPTFFRTDETGPRQCQGQALTNSFIRAHHLHAWHFPRVMTLSGRPLYPQESAVPSGAHLRGLGVCSACPLTHGWQQLSPCTSDYTACLASSLTAQQQVLVGTSFFVWQRKCFLSKKLFKGSKDQNVT